MRHNIPKSLFLTTGLAVALPFAAANAVGSGVAPGRLALDMRAPADTATGCLQKGDESGEYALTTKDGKKYGLRSSKVDLSKHVGHTVTVSGTAKHEQEEKGEKKEAGESEVADIQVSKLAMVSASCQ
jgi:hypothetical protein